MLLAALPSSAFSAKPPNHALRVVLTCLFVWSAAAVAQVQTAAKSDAPKIRVGSKSFTESVILGEMLAQLAAHGGARV